MAKNKKYSKGQSKCDRLEKKLSEYQLMIESVGDIVVKHTNSGKFSYVSRSCFDKLGFNPEELIGHSWEEYIHKDDVIELRRHHSRMEQTASTQVLQARVRRSDGIYIWYEITTRPVVSDDGGKVRESVCIYRDITHRKKAELLLEQSEHLLREVSDTVPVYIWMSDVSGRMIFFNKPWLKHVGDSLGNELGHGWQRRIHPKDKKQYLRKRKDAFDSLQKYSVELRIMNKDGDYERMVDRGVPRFADESTFVGYIGCFVEFPESLCNPLK